MKQELGLVVLLAAYLLIAVGLVLAALSIADAMDAAADRIAAQRELPVVKAQLQLCAPLRLPPPDPGIRHRSKGIA